MKCAKCGCLDDKVVDTRVSREGDSIRRRRECIECGHRFTTHEMVLRAEMVVVKRDNVREDFNPAKIRGGIRHACWKRPISESQIDKIVQSVTRRLETYPEREVPSHYIGELVIGELREVDHVAFVRFASVYHRFEDVGEFIHEIRNLTAPEAAGGVGARVEKQE